MPTVNFDRKIEDEEESEESKLAPEGCPRCGEKVNPNASFCHNCSQALNEEKAMEVGKRKAIGQIIMEEVAESEACGVTHQAVSNWVRKDEYCPSNKSAFYLLKLRQRVNPEKTAEIVK